MGPKVYVERVQWIVVLILVARIVRGQMPLLGARGLLAYCEGDDAGVFVAVTQRDLVEGWEASDSAHTRTQRE